MPWEQLQNGASVATASNAPCFHLQQNVDFSIPDRLMLGYHSSQMHMAMVYSRDGAAASLLLLEKLIDEISKEHSDLTALEVGDSWSCCQTRLALKVLK